MALFKGIDVEDLKKKVGDGVKTAQKSVNGVDVGAAARRALDTAVEGAEEAAKAVSDNVKNFNAGEAAKTVADTAVSGVNGLAKAIDNMTSETSDSKELDAKREFVKLLWFLAAVDGNVTKEEKDKISELGSMLDEGFPEYSDAIEQECMARIEESSHEFGCVNAVKMEALNTFKELHATYQEKKMLCWNLLAVANSDDLSKEEMDYIRFISEKAGVSDAVIEELRAYSTAIIELEEAKKQLQTSSRSYGEIQSLICESTNREKVIIEAAQALIADN